MKKKLFFLILGLSLITSTFNSFASDSLSLVKNFQNAKFHIMEMLSGKGDISFENAIFEVENAWHCGNINRQSFKSAIDFQVNIIRSILESDNNWEVKATQSNVITSELQSNELYRMATTNFAIFRFMTRPTFTEQGSQKILFPFYYSSNDPQGMDNWKNSQVVHLVNHHSGNCFALSSLFMILSERLNTGACLGVAPGHIYIRHADSKGTQYNVEIGSRSFPGAGSIQTVTYTSSEAVRNRIALRTLNNKQSIALCLVYLAKGYEFKTGIKDAEFSLSCAEAALKYDEHNLNAMLLKKEILEKRILKKQKSIVQLQHQKDFYEYQEGCTKIISLGYREMPVAMKNLLFRDFNQYTDTLPIQNMTNPNYLNSTTFSDTRYASLSGVCLMRR